VYHLGTPATECLDLLVGPPVGGYAYAPALSGGSADFPVM